MGGHDNRTENRKTILTIRTPPAYMRIPLKGLKEKNKKSGRATGSRGIVNLQNAEVTKMLDTKSEQK